MSTITISLNVDKFRLQLTSAIKQAKHGDFGEQSPFSIVLKDFGLIPNSYDKKTWQRFFEKYCPPSVGTDMERLGNPLLVSAFSSLLQQDSSLAERVLEDVAEALASASSSGKARAPVAPRRKTRPTVLSGSSPPMQEQLDSALSLLERAAASHNLLKSQRARIFGLADRLQNLADSSRKPTMTSAANSSVAGSVAPRISTEMGFDAHDATRDWSGTYRDHGSFGSHASYDSMDDESSP